jgi:protocatechuate 3,4-dioxygenase beta subunit
MKALLRVGVPVVLLLALGWWLARRPVARTTNQQPAALDSPAIPDSGAWARATSIVRLASDDEPGTPLVIFGNVFSANGQPATDTKMAVYQADAKGDYGQNASEPSGARLSGLLRTDSLGRYLIYTVRPGGYGGTPAHVHFVVGEWSSAENYELRFADDPANRGAVTMGSVPDTSTFATVRGVVRDPSGVLRVRRDFQLR